MSEPSPEISITIWQDVRHVTALKPSNYIPLSMHILAMQVTLNLESKASHTRKQKAQPGADYKRSKTGHAFSANNPYGKKPPGDQRQFART